MSILIEVQTCQVKLFGCCNFLGRLRLGRGCGSDGVHDVGSDVQKNFMSSRPNNNAQIRLANAVWNRLIDSPWLRD